MMSASNIQWVVMDQNVLLQNINFKKNVKTKSLGDCAAHKVFQCINDILSSDVPNSLSALTVRKPVDYCNACVLTSSNLVGPESKASQEKSLFKYMSFSSRITCKCNQKLISTTGCFFKSYKKYKGITFIVDLYLKVQINATFV